MASVHLEETRLGLKRFALLLIACGLAWPQTTPNIGLNIPARGSYNWDTLYNANWGVLDGMLAGRLNVFSYGAKGTGLVDDTAAVQAALNAAAPICGTVIFPAGKTFLLQSNPTNTTLLTYPPCVSLDGGGTLKVASGIGIFQSVFKCSLPLQPAIIHNLTIDMNGDGNPITSDPGSTNYQMTFWFVKPAPTGSGLVLEDMTFLNGHGTWTLNTYADNVTVNRCNWINWGVSSIFFDQSVLYIAGNGAVVTNNTFTGTGTEAHTAIEIHASNKTVANNVIRNFFSAIIYSSDANGGTSSNITIANNTMDNVWFGVQYWANDGGISNLNINGNTVNINRNYNYAAWGASAGGGEVGIGSYVNSHYPISNLNILGNLVNWTAETGTYPTVSFQVGIGFFTASTAPGGALTNATIANNTVSGTPGSGIAVNGGSTVSGLNVHGNTVLNPGQASALNANFRCGIMLLGTPTWRNSTVADNLLSDTQGTPTMQRGLIFAGVATDNAGAQLRVTGNTVKFVGTPTMYFNFQTSSPYFDVMVPGYAANAALLQLGSFSGAGSNPPRAAVINDTQTGRVWRNMTNEAAPYYFNSQEIADVVPTSGTYKQGDIVWAGDSAIGGFAAWVNTLSGTPGTFSKIQLSNFGVTVSGTSCTVKAISGGVITSATCP